MEHMIEIRDMLLTKIHGCFSNGMECVDTEEMGYAMDMLKDIEMAMYYEQVTQAMANAEPDEIVRMVR